MPISRLIFAFLTIHMVLHVYGAMGMPGVSSGSSLRRILSSYGALTGSNTRFGFFSPRVATGTRVRVRVQEHGQAIELGLVKLRSHDGQLRFEGMTDIFKDEGPTIAAARVGSSIAARVLDERPKADLCIVTFEALEIPPLWSSPRRAPAAWFTVAEVTIARKTGL